MKGLSADYESRFQASAWQADRVPRRRCDAHERLAPSAARQHQQYVSGVSPARHLSAAGHARHWHALVAARE